MVSKVKDFTLIGWRTSWDWFPSKLNDIETRPFFRFRSVRFLIHVRPSVLQSLSTSTDGLCRGVSTNYWNLKVKLPCSLRPRSSVSDPGSVPLLRLSSGNLSPDVWYILVRSDLFVLGFWSGDFLLFSLTERVRTTRNLPLFRGERFTYWYVTGKNS